MWWRRKSTWMTIASPARFYLDDKFCCQGQGHPGRAGSTRRSVTVLLAVYRCVSVPVREYADRNSFEYRGTQTLGGRASCG